MEYKLYKASIIPNAYQFSKGKHFAIKLTDEQIEKIERVLNENNGIDAGL